MIFKMRTTAPSTNDGCYYSSKNALFRDGYGMPNCTCYSLGRWIELLGYVPKLCLGNAGRWYSYNDGYARGSQPKLGAIAVWGLNGSNVNGHVAVVEDFGNGWINCSNSAYKSTNFYMKTYTGNYNFGSYIFKGFIYPPINFEKESPAKITSFSASATEKNVALSFKADKDLDYAKYSLNGANFVDLPVNSVIGNLTPNTSYKVQINVRTKGTDLWTKSDIISFNTHYSIIGTPVERNDNEQLQITNNILFVRDNPSGNKLGYAKEGIYNILDTKVANGYTWIEIEKGKWVARNEEWNTILPKKEEPKIEDTPKEQEEPIIDIKEEDSPIMQEEQKQPAKENIMPNTSLLDILKKLIQFIIDILKEKL